MEEMRFRLAEPPVGGSRIAWSYLAAVVGVLVGGLVWVVWTQFTDLVCSVEMDLGCQLGWMLAGLLLGAVAGLAPAAWVFRLGWEWWLALAAGVLSVPLWQSSTPVTALVALALPALAALATWTGPRRPAWRPWAITGVALLLVVASGVYVFA